MVKRVLTVRTSDFQGGLNLNADPFQLGRNQTQDCLNVDFDPLGGFGQRQGVTVANTTALASTPQNLWTFLTPDGSTYRYVVAQQGNTIAYSTGGNFTSWGTAAPFNVATTGPMRATTFQPLNSATANNYIQRNAEQAAVRWTGAAATALTNPAVGAGTWNESYASPAGGYMPKAKFIATHRNYVFVANTLEDKSASITNVAYTSRVRFSHPGQPEDWRALDYIDFEPGSGDAITGIASWNDRLLVFKNNAIFMLQGYDADTFDVVNVSHTLGAVSQDAIAVTEQGVFFFSWPEGLHFFDGSKIHNVFYPLRPMVFDGTVNRAARAQIRVQWVKQRVWVSVPTGSSTVNSQTYVFDPLLQGGGGWTRYQLGGYGLGAGVEWQPPGEDAKWFAMWAGSSGTTMVELHKEQGYDEFVSGTQTAVPTRFQTPWVDVGNTALVKAWRRPVFVFRTKDPYTLFCQGYRDYDNTVAGSPFSVVSNPVGSNTLTWDPAGADTDADKWSTDAAPYLWAADVGTPLTIQKGARLGRAVAVCLKVTGPSSAESAARWSVDSITWKYVPKRIRS